jgi:uncharacterized membrane protein
MLYYDWKGTRIAVTAALRPQAYQDLDNVRRTRLDRQLEVSVQFWDFLLENGNLFEYSFVRAALSYFIHAYWKRTSKQESRIDLDVTLPHDKGYPALRTLHFTAHQKNKRHYLHIYLGGEGEAHECYLSGHEVLTLEAAIGKAMGQLSPALPEALPSAPRTL